MSSPEGGDGVAYVRRDSYGDASEYGGVSGLIQPFPHEPTPAERRMQIMGVDSEDIEAVAPESQKLR